VIKTLATYLIKRPVIANASSTKLLLSKSFTSNALNSAADTAIAKDDPMTDQVDNWHKLARYDTNMQGELHANLLRNNGITVSLQPLSAIPGMNSGVVLWVENADLAQAKRIIDGVDSDTDGETLLNNMSDAELGIVPDSPLNSSVKDSHGGSY
jgi:hypothetical protein